METHQRTPKDIQDNIAKLCNEPRIVSEKEKDTARYVLEKSLRISSATLCLTALMDIGTPVRTSLEKTSMRLVEDASSAPLSLVGRGALMVRLRTLGALFETAHLAGVIAENNATIIALELTSLSELLVDIGWAEGSRSLSPTLLSVDTGAHIFTTDTYQRPSTTYKGHVDTYSVRHESTQEGHTIKDTEGTIKDTGSGVVHQHKERVQEAQKDRRATILGIIQRKDRITVKDVSNVIKDCSEKTIQRELLTLVGQGVLVKEGERRWSTYRLA